MPWRLLIMPLWNLTESFVDNVFRDKVASPVPGSVVYCDLAAGYADHSGIYVGDNRIVHMHGSGTVESVAPGEFIARLGGLNTAMSIYVSCSGKSPVGSEAAAARARGMVANRRRYILLFDNCHQFAAGCLTGDFDGNACNFMWMLKQCAGEQIGADTWRVWDIDLLG